MKRPARLSSQSAAFVLRLLAIARRRDQPLLPALASASTRTSRTRFPAALDELRDAGEDGLLDALEAQLRRGPDPAAAGALRSLRAIGLDPDGLTQLAAWVGNRSSSRRARLRAVTYPIALTLFGCLGFMVLFYGLLGPGLGSAFAQLYDSVGVELPVMTTFFLSILGFTKQMIANPVTAIPYFIVVLASTLGMLVVAVRFPTGRLALWIPLASRWAFLEAAQVYTSTMAMLLRSEVALPDAARLAASAVPNVVLAERLGNLAEFVDSGEGFAEALVESKALPRTVAWRIWASWYRSELADELSSLAGDLRTQLDDQERAILSLTRPLAILLAGFALTPLILLIVAMYLPMFMLVSLIG